MQKQLKDKPHRIVRLEDGDGDGRFDKQPVFADKMMVPEGTMWLDGSLYVAAPPRNSKLTDPDGDGVADQRVEWFAGKTLTGCANDLHGPYAGPDGWVYWCKGAFAEQTYDRGPGKPPLKTKAAHIFAAGDVCGPYEIVHLAVQQGELAARNAARVLKRLGELEKMDYSLKLFAVFTHPEVATVGLSEHEAKEQHYDVLTAKYAFADHGKSMVKGETHGFVKLVADRATRRILGGACVGPNAAELIHEIVVAMSFGATAGQLARVPHYHPTLSEIWTYPAEELAEH